MLIESTRFGTLNVAASDVIRFNLGMYGFDAYPDFVIVPDKQSEPFINMQSISEPALCFILLNPIHIMPDYKLNLCAEDLALISANVESDIDIYFVVTIESNIDDTTVNPSGPVAINRRDQCAMQITDLHVNQNTRVKLGELL